MHAWSKRLNEVLKQRGWSQSELARRAGVSKENVKKYCQGLISQPRGDTLPRLAEALDVHGIWLRDGIGPQWRRIPLVGSLEAGGQFHSIEFDALDGGGNERFGNSLVFELVGMDPIAVEVQDGSLEPVYRIGDRLLCARMAPNNARDFLDRECLVQLASGEGYLAWVHRGSKTGRFVLTFSNGQALSNAELAWAAPIIWIRRGEA